MPAHTKKILFVITKANWGGAQRYVFDLATTLPKDRFEVAVAFGQKGLLAQKLQDTGIQTFLLHTMQRDVSLLTDVWSFFELLGLFRREMPDVVHLNSSKAAGVGALAARVASWRGGHPIKIVFTAHGWPFLEKRAASIRALIWAASWITALLSHTVITISEHDLKETRKMPFVGGKSVRIYNGIDLDFTLGSGQIIRDSFPKGVHITGTIGELTQNKNQQALIEEAHKNQTMFVAIVGEGEERPHLEALIQKYHLKERVKLFGFMPASEVLRGFDTFALPSLKEGLPYVLLEAKAAGLPIVANRVGGVGEILDAKDMSQFSLERMVSETKKLY